MAPRVIWPGSAWYLLGGGGYKASKVARGGPIPKRSIRDSGGPAGIGSDEALAADTSRATRAGEASSLATENTPLGSTAASSASWEYTTEYRASGT